MALPKCVQPQHRNSLADASAAALKQHSSSIDLRKFKYIVFPFRSSVEF